MASLQMQLLHRIHIDGVEYSVGEIAIGSFREKFRSRLDYWSDTMYIQHWRRSLDRFMNGEAVGYLITSIANPSAESVTEWWLLYRLNREVVVRNALLLPERGLVDPHEAYDLIPAYRARTDDGLAISEWRVPADNFSASIG
jgi:hypothetical protein